MLECFVHGCEHTALVVNTVLPELGCTFWTHPAQPSCLFISTQVRLGEIAHRCCHCGDSRPCTLSPAFLGESVGPRKEQGCGCPAGAFPSSLAWGGGTAKAQSPGVLHQPEELSALGETKQDQGKTGGWLMLTAMSSPCALVPVGLIHMDYRSGFSQPLASAWGVTEQHWRTLDRGQRARSWFSFSQQLPPMALWADI